MDVQGERARNTSTKDSVRNKSKASNSDRKPAFKAVLESPYHLSWPAAPASTTNAILKDLSTHFKDAVKRRKDDSSDDAAATKTMKADERRAMRKQRREAKEAAIAADTAKKNTADNDNTSPPAVPIVGINAVTRDIEAGEASTSKVVLACPSDVNPSRLLAHLPSHIAAHNSRHSRSVVLIELPKGSEEALAVSMNLKRVAVLSLSQNHPLTATILNKLDDIDKYTLKAPWLNVDQVVYVPTKVNMVETSIPKDMRKAKEEKKKVQAAKKERIIAYKEKHNKHKM